MLTAQTLAEWARELGFADMGMCPADDFRHSQHLVESQKPLAERRQLRFCPKDDTPEIRSIAVLLWPYAPAQDSREAAVFVDSYYAASNAAYHAARSLEAKMLEAGCFARANVSYPAKEAAIRAGMGVIGRNSLLITPKYGSRVVIILVATGIELPQTLSLHQKRDCLGCGRCIKACPSGALDENGMSHPERCLRNFIMEGVVVPENLRKGIGSRLIGCDTCQRVCPMQRSNTQFERSKYTLDEFITEDATEFSKAAGRLADEIGRNAARPQRIRAQAALLAGNSGQKRYLPVLENWSNMPFPAVSEHARWAIQQIESSAEQT